MKKLGNPVLVREQEWEGRPKAFDLLAGVIVHYEKILEQHAAGVSGCLSAMASLYFLSLWRMLCIVLIRLGYVAMKAWCGGV